LCQSGVIEAFLIFYLKITNKHCTSFIGIFFCHEFTTHKDLGLLRIDSVNDDQFLLIWDNWSCIKAMLHLTQIYFSRLEEYWVFFRLKVRNPIPLGYTDFYIVYYKDIWKGITNLMLARYMLARYMLVTLVLINVRLPL
jgi:hypothetical protein